MPNPNSDSRYKIIDRGQGVVEVVFIGDWTIGVALPNIEEIADGLQRHSVSSVVFSTAESPGRWDSRLVCCVLRLIERFEQQNIGSDISGLPQGVRGLIKLANSVPEVEGARKIETKRSLTYKLGAKTIAFAHEVRDLLAFTGEAWLSVVRFVSGKRCFRRRDFLLVLEECGANALPIVTLISVLIGLILAFVGSIQLRLFGADIYIANLVALGMVREMGAMMTAIIMAGRTGAAYAAQLGTMQVNEEIDAFKTMGITAMDFLVLPRLLALILMMPLLTLYADFLGIVGGFVVGVGLLDLSFTEYYHQTITSIQLMDCATGLIKSTVFGVLVALSGCMRGMQCGRSSDAVGKAATAAVVSGIVSIVVADSVLTVVYDSLKI